MFKGEIGVKETELSIRKSTLKDVEIWLNQQYLEIEKELEALKGEMK